MHVVSQPSTKGCASHICHHIPSICLKHVSKIYANISTICIDTMPQQICLKSCAKLCLKTNTIHPLCTSIIYQTSSRHASSMCQTLQDTSFKTNIKHTFNHVRLQIYRPSSALTTWYKHLPLISPQSHRTKTDINRASREECCTNCGGASWDNLRLTLEGQLN
jgi:hypothetical protein